LIELRKCLQCLIECDQLTFSFRQVIDRFIERDFRDFASALFGIPCARGIHEDATHDLRGHRKKVGAVLPADILRSDQLEVGLVDESIRLQAISRCFLAHEASCGAAQFVVDQRHQALQCRLIALRPCAQ